MPYFSLADTLSGWSDTARLERGKAVGPEYSYWNDKENIALKKRKITFRRRMMEKYLHSISACFLLPLIPAITVINVLLTGFLLRFRAIS